MEYLYYIATILAILAVCYFTARVPSEEKLAGVDEKPGEQKNSSRRQPVQSAVPVPWGWPGSDIEHYQHTSHHESGMSDSLHRWVDHLIATKQTVDNDEYLQHRESCMRALLEDRFVSPSHMRTAGRFNSRQALQNGARQSIDQMHGFSSGKLNKIESKMNSQPYGLAIDTYQAAEIRYEDVKDVKTPWGW